MTHAQLRFSLVLVTAVAGLFACSSSNGSDGGTAQDSGSPVTDAGKQDAGAVDSGNPDTDAGMADAGTPPDFTCAGQLPPSTAPASVTVTGTVGTINLQTQKFSALADAAVAVRAIADDSALGATTSASDGKFSITLATGGVPLSAYVFVSHSGYVSSALFPATPVSGDTMMPAISLYTSTVLGFFAAAAGVSVDSDKGQLISILTDCQDAPLVGATLSTTPAPGAIRYLSGNAPSSSATATDSTGAAIAFNVPAGAATVAGTWKGTPLQQHPVKSLAGTLLQTQIRP